MATNFTLDDIRAAAERKYGSTDIQVGDVTVSLLNPLRLPKEKRDALFAAQSRLEDEGADQEAIFDDLLRTIAGSEHQANVLLAAVGSDLALKAQIFETYSEAQQAGEASPSAT